MSQLTSIEQCKAGMTVYDACFGKGHIIESIGSFTKVKFDSGHVINFYELDKYNHISRLYTEPNEISKPVNPDQ